LRQWVEKSHYALRRIMAGNKSVDARSAIAEGTG